MRHGKPDIDRHLRLNAAEFGAWLDRYNAVGIDSGCQPPPSAIAQAKQCAYTVCSNHLRSLESARALGIVHLGLSDSTFREMDMPHASWPFPKLPVVAWSVFFRLAWVFGYSAGGESYRAAKARARACAEHLAALAAAHDSVIFVGHGLLNRFIAKHLKTMGWSCIGPASEKYWEFNSPS